MGRKYREIMHTWLDHMINVFYVHNIKDIIRVLLTVVIKQLTGSVAATVNKIGIIMDFFLYRP